MWYYVNKERQQCGPVTVDALKTMLASGEITKRTHLWQEGRSDWVRLEELAPTLGITLAAPPPTPPATVAMPVMRPAEPAAMAPPPYQAPAMPPQAPPSYQAPAPAAPPAYAPTPQAPPAYAAPSPPAPFQPPMPAGFGAPAYPQQGVPVVATSAGSGVGKFFAAFIGFCLLGFFAYQKLGYLIPGVSEKMAANALKELIDDLEPVRAEIAQVYKEQNTCPGANLKVKTEVNSEIVENFNYGSYGDDNECAVETYVSENYKLKALAKTRVLFILRKGEWLCGMSADDKYRPTNCDKIAATTE
jgi:GYF domain 2